MRFGEIVRFEVAHRLRLGSTWFYFALVLALIFFLVEGILIQEAIASGNTGSATHANAPYFVFAAHLFYSMMGMVVTAALFSDAAIRDIEHRMHPLFFTAPIRKIDYLGGRFLGVFCLNALFLTIVPPGFFLGLKLLVADPAIVGPYRLETFLQPYFTLLLPNLFITGSIMYVVAAMTRRSLASYVVGVILFMGSFISSETLSDLSAYRGVAALIDPFGFNAMQQVTQFWTPFERNTNLMGLQGLILWNRLIWIGGALAALGFVFHRFQFTHDAGTGRRRTSRALTVEMSLDNATAVFAPHTARSFHFSARLRQTAAVAGRSFGEIFAQRPLLILVAACVGLFFINGWDSLVVLDTPTWPVTYVVAQNVIGELLPLMYLLIAIFAGELIWRDRETRTSELLDAAPVPNWVLLCGKFLALVLAAAALQTVLMVSGIVLQALKGYYDFEIPLYLQILFGPQLIEYVLWAALAMLVHVIVDQKYLGHLAFAIAFGFFRIGAAYLRIENNLLVFPKDPGWTYSDMSGFGPFLVPYLWYKLYWGAWTILFAVVANLLWRRGRETGVRRRLREMRLRVTRPLKIAAALAIALILVTGGFVFYNTNVANEYLSRDERIARRAEYEMRYGRFRGIPQPRVAGADLHVEIYPDRRSAEISGSYVLLNRSQSPIDSIHILVDSAVDLGALDVNRGAQRILEDHVHGYHILDLQEPLASGDSVRLTFSVAFTPRGFTNQRMRTAVEENGTFIDEDLLPAVGYRTDLELTHEPFRRKHGLAPHESMPSPHAEDAQWRSPRNTEWFHAQVVIGTSRDQIALAPGALRRTWVENGRRYFHYVSDAPIKDVFSFLSARYVVREDRWGDIPIRIYHHPSHTFNLDRMVHGAKMALEYLSAEFGPYPYGQFWIAEIPRHAGNFAQAMPNSVAYSEGFGFIARAEEGIDYPFAVTAHEVAHQWWGGQFSPANVLGSRVLYETLAHYSAMMVMEKASGPERVRRFLDEFRFRYLVGRQNRGHSEVPLLLAGEQKYIAYDKGAVVMYALRNYIGEKKVNAALRRFLDRFRFSGPPHPTTLDLYRELKAGTPDSLHYLLTDLFEEITVWDMRTESVSVERDKSGGYRVSLQVDAQKMKADSTGSAQPAPMNDLVEVGVFAGPEKPNDPGEPLYLQQHRIRSGMQTITVTVPRPPIRAGIDPYNRLIEWKRDDNVIQVPRADSKGR